jgi:hypothetical protein
MLHATPPPREAPLSHLACVFTVTAEHTREILNPIKKIISMLQVEGFYGKVDRYARPNLDNLHVHL